MLFLATPQRRLAPLTVTFPTEFRRVVFRRPQHRVALTAKGGLGRHGGPGSRRTAGDPPPRTPPSPEPANPRCAGVAITAPTHRRFERTASEDRRAGQRHGRPGKVVDGLVRGLVLRHDVGRNAPALVDLDAFRAGPGPHIGRRGATGGDHARTAGPATRTTTGRPAGTTSRTDVSIQGFAELLRITFAEVNLVGNAVKSERERFVSRTPVEIVDQCDLDLLCHGAILSPDPANCYRQSQLEVRAKCKYRPVSQSRNSMRVFPRVFGLARSRSRNSATPS